MVSRKTRREIAAVIHKLPGDRYAVAERFADVLANDNPRFDREKFMAAALWGIEARRRSLIPARGARTGSVRSTPEDVAAEAHGRLRR